MLIEKKIIFQDNEVGSTNSVGHFNDCFYTGHHRCENSILRKAEKSLGIRSFKVKA